jgi:hypothetical protein
MASSFGVYAGVSEKTWLVKIGTRWQEATPAQTYAIGNQWDYEFGNGPLDGQQFRDAWRSEYLPHRFRAPNGTPLPWKLPGEKPFQLRVRHFVTNGEREAVLELKERSGKHPRWLRLHKPLP